LIPHPRPRDLFPARRVATGCLIARLNACMPQAARRSGPVAQGIERPPPKRRLWLLINVALHVLRKVDRFRKPFYEPFQSMAP